MSKYRYINGEPPEGTPTLGVVYHMLHQKAIKAHFIAAGNEPPEVYGYVVVDEDEEDQCKDK